MKGWWEKIFTESLGGSVFCCNFASDKASSLRAGGVKTSMELLLADDAARRAGRGERRLTDVTVL